MFLRKLELKNWRAYTEAAVSLEPVSVIVGRNGAGKSSLAAAVEFVLTGKTRWTEGQGLEALIRSGAASAEVAVELEGADGLERIVRSVPHKLSGPKGRALRDKQAAIYEALAVSEPVLRAAFDGGRLVSDPARAGAIFSQYLGLEFDEDSLYRMLAQWAREHGAAEDVFGPVLREVCAGKRGGVEILDVLDRELRARRTEVGRMVTKYRAFVQSGGEAEEFDVQAAERELAALREELEEKIRARAEAQEKARELAALREEQEALRGLLGEETDRETWMERLNSSLARVTSISQQLDQVMTDANRAQCEAIAIGERAQAFGLTIARIVESNGGCPLAPEDIRCPLERSFVDGLVERLKKQKEQAEEEQSEAIRRRRQAECRVESLRREEGEAQERAARARQALEAIDRLAEIEDRIREIGDVEVPANGEDALRDRMADIARRLEEAAQVRARAEEVRRHREALEQFEAERAALDVLVEACGPKGVRSSLLSERVGEVQAKMNEWLAQLTGGEYGVALSWEKGLGISVTANGRTTPIHLLSQSEQKRVGIVLQAVLAHVSGLRWVLIDEADMLDSDNRAALASLLIELVKGGLIDQAVVLSTVGDVEPMDPGIPGVGVYRVHSGAISRLSS